MKRILFLISFLLLNISLFSQNFFIGVSGGILNGQINEYVYESSRTKSNCHESELDWDIVNIPYAQVNLEASLFKYLLLKTNFKYGFPKESGFIQDYDWLNPVSQNIGELTNYSIHTNYLSKYMDLSCNLGAKIYLPGEIKLIPYVDFFYLNFLLAGYDGYCIYKDNNYQKQELEGNVIQYQMISKGINFGIGVEINTLGFLDINLYAEASPYLVWSDGYDSHVLINKTKHDEVYETFSAAGYLSIYLNINEKNKAGVEASVKYHPESYGTLHSVKPEQGGLSFFLYDFSFIYKYGLM